MTPPPQLSLGVAAKAGSSPLQESSPVDGPDSLSEFPSCAPGECPLPSRLTYCVFRGANVTGITVPQKFCESDAAAVIGFDLTQAAEVSPPTPGPYPEAPS
jgi:hypothetical protein